jgi:hypothetical protein
MAIIEVTINDGRSHVLVIRATPDHDNPASKRVPAHGLSSQELS